MKLIEYYIQLFAVFSNCKVLQEIQVTRESISKELNCSERNVINILNKLEDKKWIDRQKGKGRGHKTTITFLKTFEEMLKIYENDLPKYDDIERLLVLLESYNLLTENNSNISSLILHLFGVKSSEEYTTKEQTENDRLMIPYFRTLYSLDPMQVERQTERHLVEQIFNTLVTFNEETNRVKPSIAYYWESEENGQLWTFYIRKGVMFHNGKNLTTEDVKFTFERMGEKLKYLYSINCKSNHVIQFRFAKPVITFDLLLCSPKCSIVPINFGNESEVEFSRIPIGTGPYMINEHEPNILKLSANHFYFQERAHIDEITIFILPSIEKYLNISEVDRGSLFYIPFTIGRDKPGQFQFIDRKNLSIKYLMWNMRKASIKSNHLLRRKVASILNRDKMINDLSYPRFQPRSSFLPIEKPEAIVESPNYFDFTGTLTLMTHDLAPNREDCKWIKAECSKHGIEIEIIVVPYSCYITNLNRADIVLSEYITEKVEEVALYNLFQSETNVIYNLADQTRKSILQDCMVRVMNESEQNNRFKIIEEMEKLLLEDHTILPLYSTYQKALYHENLMGISMNTVGLVPFKELFFKSNPL